LINRTGVVVRRAQPFIDWAAALDGVGQREIDDDPTLYLIPACDEAGEAWRLLEEGYAAIFEIELEDCEPRASMWPAERTFAMFRAWFDVSICGWIEDLCDAPLGDADFLDLEPEF